MKDLTPGLAKGAQMKDLTPGLAKVVPQSPQNNKKNASMKDLTPGLIRS
jgi:hypothetical protein